MQINPGSVTGHLAASGVFPADVEMLNREIGAFLERGRVKRAARPGPTPADDQGAGAPGRAGSRPGRR
jgi:hypothetical protein